MPVQTRTIAIRKIAISWAIESIKTVLGYEDIRNSVIQYYFPHLEHVEDMRTFDAFQQYEMPPFIDKALEITDYCEDLIVDDSVSGIVLMTAANIQDSARDIYTHYQSFIIDKDKKRVFAIDPASTADGVGIYEAAITETVVLPIFRSYDYDCKFLTLTHPAQTNKADVFCQTWTIIIMIQALRQMFASSAGYIGVIQIPAPRPKLRKYGVLLDFYKEILGCIPVIGEALQEDYLYQIENNKDEISKYADCEKIRAYCPVDLFLSMTAEELMA
jgi:hypothetical protein